MKNTGRLYVTYHGYRNGKKFYDEEMLLENSKEVQAILNDLGAYDDAPDWVRAEGLDVMKLAYHDIRELARNMEEMLSTNGNEVYVYIDSVDPEVDLDEHEKMIEEQIANGMFDWNAMYNWE